MVNPTPKWICTNPATYFTSTVMMDFCNSSGIGLLTTPAESHEMMGGEESTIKILKEAVSRILKDEPTLEIENAYRLAAHGHNQTAGASGFSPFQWTRGSSSPHENFPLGINPNKAFDGMYKLREKARVAYEMANAKHKLSKLGNSVARPTASYQPGQLVTLWRQRSRPGKTTGKWVGPVRTLLHEGGTLWLATGATLIRARWNQVRPCTRREELQATLEGTAVMSTPATMETLMKSFTGRNYLNLTGETPSLRQQQEDLQAADVRVEPGASRIRPDAWLLRHEQGRQWLIRKHTTPRLALFVPGRAAQPPIAEELLSGRRLTTVRPMVQGAEEVIIEDADFRAGKLPRQVLSTWLM